MGEFGHQYHLSNVDDLVLLLGKKSCKEFLSSTMGAVENHFGGKIQLCIDGSATSYSLKSLVSCLSELQSSVDLGLLVASHGNTPDSAALITERGGCSVVGKALRRFRKTIPAFLQKHSDIFYKREIASRPSDWKMQIVRFLEELRS